MTILVKSVSSLSEARYCAGMLVDMISFEFNPQSDLYIDNSKFNEIKNWLSGIKILGQDFSASQDEIQKIIDDNNLDGFIFSESQADFQINTPIKIIESNQNIPGFDFIVSNQPIKDGKNIIIGYDFENAYQKFENTVGFGFLGTKEKTPGYCESDQLIEALEHLEESIN